MALLACVPHCVDAFTDAIVLHYLEMAIDSAASESVTFYTTHKPFVVCTFHTVSFHGNITAFDMSDQEQVPLSFF